VRFAIFSDVHGNLEALDAVLEQCEHLGADRLVCLGDTVGYGAEPGACVERVQKVAGPILAGNHDWGAVGLEDTRFFNTGALAAIRWTARQLSDRDQDYLSRLPLMAREDGAMFVHSSPESPGAWHYLFTTGEGRRALSATDAAITFVGHSHYAFICSESDNTRVVREGAASLEPEDRYLVNVGSVGQPRDMDPRAAFALWVPDAREVTLHRVEYDVAAAQEKIRDAGLPGICADRLEFGG